MPEQRNRVGIEVIQLPTAGLDTVAVAIDTVVGEDEADDAVLARGLELRARAEQSHGDTRLVPAANPGAEFRDVDDGSLGHDVPSPSGTFRPARAVGSGAGRLAAGGCHVLRE